MAKKILFVCAATVLLISFIHPGHCQPLQGRPSQPRRAQQRPANIERQPATLNNTDITISVGNAQGPIRPLLGVNAGPTPSGEPENADVTAEYQTCGVTMVRTHDFYGPFDLSSFYPDINADPYAPASYSFKDSDEVFTAITNGGFEPYMRIGESYNKVRIPANDKEQLNLVQAGCEMIRHYRIGSNNGFTSKFRYVEIWNEPDNQKFWPGNFSSYLSYFAETYTALKQQFPELKIGGPGFVVATYKIPQARANAHQFLSYMKQKNIKPDFLSFHIYSNDPAEYYDAVHFFRQAARNAGFENMELHLTEWNTENSSGGIVYRLQKKAIPYVTAIWIALQEAGLNEAFFYRGTDTNIKQPNFYGMFFADGKEKPAAKAFTLWKEFSTCARRLSALTGISLLDDAPSIQGDLKPLWILAGERSSREIMLLVSNISDQTIRYTVQLPRQIRSIEVAEAGPPMRKTQSYSADKPTISINPLTVHLLRIQTE